MDSSLKGAEWLIAGLFLDRVQEMLNAAIKLTTLALKVACKRCMSTDSKSQVRHVKGHAQMQSTATFTAQGG